MIYGDIHSERLLWKSALKWSTHTLQRKFELHGHLSNGQVFVLIQLLLLKWRYEHHVALMRQMPYENLCRMSSMRKLTDWLIEVVESGGGADDDYKLMIEW